MNLVFTYVFDDLFINSFDFSKLSSLSKSLDSETLWEMAYEENIGIEGIATWVYNPARNTKWTTKHLFFYDIFDDNNIVLDKYKDEPLFYQIDMFGGSDLSFPGDNRNTTIDLIPYRVIDALKKNKNFVIHIDYCWEGIIEQIPLKMLHTKLHEYNIPTKKCIFSFAGYNQKEWYDAFCKKFNISQKIKFNHNHWVWKTKGEEYSKYKKAKEFHKVHLDYKIEPKKYDFNCLNRRLRTHRLYILAKLNQLNLIDNNIVTYDFTINDNQKHLKEIPNIHENELLDFTELKKYILDLQINNDKKFYDFEDLESLYGIMYEDASVYEDSMFSFISETSFLEDEFYISEKVVKALGQNHPFIVFGNFGTLKELKRMGFETFEPFIDESYDLEPNIQKRMDMVFDEVIKLVNKTEEEKLIWMKNIKPILEKNYKVLLNLFYNHKISKRDNQNNLKRLACNYLI